MEGMTTQQEKYFCMIWQKGIMKLSDLETNSEEYILVYDRIVSSLKKTRYIAANSNNENFLKAHESLEAKMNILEKAVRYNNYPKIGAMI